MEHSTLVKKALQCHNIKQYGAQYLSEKSLTMSQHKTMWRTVPLIKKLTMSQHKTMWSTVP